MRRCRPGVLTFHDLPKGMSHEDARAELDEARRFQLAIGFCIRRPAQHRLRITTGQTLKRWIVRENYGDPLMQQCPSQPEVGDRVDGAMPYPR
jgi:hypothetical protein